MQQGDTVIWDGYKTVILLEYDADFVCVATGDTAQLVHKSELTAAY